MRQVNSEPSGSYKDTLPLLPQGDDFQAQAFHHIACFIYTGPFCFVFHRCCECGVLEINAFTFKWTTKLWICMVEIQARISEPPCVPIHHHQNAITTCDL